MKDDELFERQMTSLVAFVELVGASSPAARIVRDRGVTAAIVPAAPNRSVCNSVTYEDASLLEEALPGLTDSYAQAGIAAWTVWVPESDGSAARLLKTAGHVLDAAPRAMGLDMNDLQPSPTSDVKIATANVSQVGAVNDVAYGLGGNEFEGALQSGSDQLKLYGAHRQDKLVSSVGALRTGNDCGVYFVATLPEAGRAGLATALMTRALEEARRDGCNSATLQATKAGYPVYARLGFRDLGAMQMWERRIR